MLLQLALDFFRKIENVVSQEVNALTEKDRKRIFITQWTDGNGNNKLDKGLAYQSI